MSKSPHSFIPFLLAGMVFACPLSEVQALEASDLLGSARQAALEDKLQDAEKLYREAILNAPDNKNRARALHEFASFLMAKKHWEEAENILTQCLSMRRLASETEVSTLQTLSNLALVKHKLKKEEEAESLYKECITLKRKACPDSASLSLTLTNLANLYSEARRPVDAEPLYLEAFEIDKKLYGENHVECGQDLFNLGGLYYKCNEPKNALIYLERAQKIFEAAGAKQQMVRNLHYIALCHSHLQDHKKSAVYNEKALVLQETEKGSQHIDTVVHLLNFAHAKSKSGEIKEAESIYKKALDRASKSTPVDELKLCECNAELANFYRLQKKFEAAEHYYLKALVHYDSLSKHDKRNLYALPHSYSVMLDQLKRSEESHHLAHKYLHVFKPHHKPHHESSHNRDHH